MILEEIIVLQIFLIMKEYQRENNQDPGLDSRPGAYFAHEKDRQRMNRLPPRIDDAKMKLFDRNRPRCKKNLQNSNQRFLNPKITLIATAFL